MTRDEFLVYNVTAWLAEQYIDEEMEPASFLAAASDDAALLTTVTQKLVELSEKGTRYLEVESCEGIDQAFFVDIDPKKEERN